MILPWIILLCVVGLVLVFAEMLMPGFGIFGILGAICLLGTSMLVAKVYGIAAFLITVVLLVIVFWVMIAIVKKTGLYNKVVLRDKQEMKDFDESTLEGMVGAEGLTQTTLRPFGVAVFDGKHIDVTSDGDFIDRGCKVRIVKISGKTVTVVPCEETDHT